MSEKQSKSNIADILIELRNQNNLSQEALSEQIGIKRDTYAQYERTTNPPLWVIKSLCEFYKISSDIILSLKPLSTEYTNYTIQNPQGVKLGQPIVYSTNSFPECDDLERSEILLIEKFRELPDGTKADYIARMISESDINNENKS